MAVGIVGGVGTCPVHRRANQLAGISASPQDHEVTSDPGVLEHVDIPNATGLETTMRR